MFESLEPTAIAFGTFVLVALASRWIGQFFSRYGLPYITGYLLAGMVAGPFILGMMSADDPARLRFIDELSLAVIAFIAGSELYLKELRSRMRPILLNTAGIVLVTPILIGIAIYIATDFISFTEGMDQTSRIAVAVLGATILLALSPASTIAVIQEVRARGDFTRTVLSVTVVMDVIIIIFFAITAAFAAALLDDAGLNASFIIALAIDLIVALVGGIAVGKLLEGVLATGLHRMVKIALVMAIGLGIFVISFELTALTKEAGFEIHLEPLLISMIAGFFITNYTNYRDQFDEILHDVSPIVYVAFFTLTGVALKLDILLATIGIATALFLVRMFSIFLGSYAGGTLAGEPTKFKRVAWMGLITQAGIALGLAREVSVEFPALGDSFATLIISVVVLNEIFGPLFLKSALRRVGEAHEPESTEPDGQRDAVIFGVESLSVSLARQLDTNGWNVQLVDTDQQHIKLFEGEAERFSIKQIDSTENGHLESLITPNTDAVIAMMEDDNDNYNVMRYGCEKYDIKRLVVRLNDMARANDFLPTNAMVVNPTSAMVTLLDQMVRAPQSAALMTHQDPDYDITQVTVTNPDIDGMLVRDLRLPADVLILEIARNRHSVVPNGYTSIHNHDEITLVGTPQGLKDATTRLGY